MHDMNLALIDDNTGAAHFGSVIVGVILILVKLQHNKQDTEARDRKIQLLTELERMRAEYRKTKDPDLLEVIK